MPSHLAACATAAMTLLALTACGGRAGPGGARPEVNPFPAPAELERITRQPLPEAAEQPAPVAIDTWTLGGPFPADPAGAPPPDAPGAALVLDVGAATKRVPTAGMHCAARELARFVATNDGAPSPGLQAFVGSRCGVPVTSLALRWISGEVGPAEADDAVLQRWAPGPLDGLREAISPMPPGSIFGAAFAREGERAAWMMVAQGPETRLEGYTGVPDADGRILVRGVARRGYPVMEAMITRGRFGYAPCVPDLIDGDRFGFACPVDPADTRARIEVLGVPEGAILGDIIVGLDAWPTGAPAETWSAPPGVDRRPVTDTAALAEAFTAALNALRTTNGLDPVALDAEQSRVVQALAPYYWSSLSGGGERGLADQVALGTMAGYRVQGRVERGLFAATRRWGAPDAGLMLRDMLASPGRRRTLFMPGIRVIALGTTELGPQQAGLMVGTYRTFDEAGFDAAEAGRAARTRLDALRAARGEGRLTPWPEVQARLDAVAATIGPQNLENQQALSKALDVAAGAVRVPLQGIIVEAHDLDTLTLPDGLTGDMALPVAISAGYTLRGPHPWIRRIVLIVMPATQTATAPGTPPALARASGAGDRNPQKP